MSIAIMLSVGVSLAVDSCLIVLSHVQKLYRYSALQRSLIILLFGVVQGLLVLSGALLGVSFSHQLQSVGTIIAGVVLAAIAIHMGAEVVHSWNVAHLLEVFHQCRISVALHHVIWCHCFNLRQESCVLTADGSVMRCHSMNSCVHPIANDGRVVTVTANDLVESSADIGSGGSEMYSSDIVKQYSSDNASEEVLRITDYNNGVQLQPVEVIVWKYWLSLAVLTSLDALAVGAGFGVADASNIWALSSVCLVTTVVMCTLACMCGVFYRARYERLLTLAGAILLLGVSIKFFFGF